MFEGLGLAVIALGGNAILRPGEEATFASPNASPPCDDASRGERHGTFQWHGHHTW